MSEGDLVCNYKKCRKSLSSIAWVTSCSHIFCDEDGTREFQTGSYICPACSTSLSGRFDVLRIDLQPSEQYKSMLLAGHKPEVIMEICSRAMSFWTYQAHQERTYQEFIANKAKEKSVQLEQYYEQVIGRTQTELASLKTQLAGVKKELENTKKKYNEVSEKLMERSRQYQKLQSMYDALRRKCITHSSFEGDGGPGLSRPSSAFKTHSNHELPITTGEDFRRNKQQLTGHVLELGNIGAALNHSMSDKDFVLKPHPTPPLSASDSNLSNVNNRFHFGLGTPARNPQRR